MLNTLNEVAGCEDREPLGALDSGWDAPVLVSGMRVEQLHWWRIAYANASPPETGGIVETDSELRVTWGPKALVIPQGRIWTDPNHPQGIWVAQPADASRPFWD